MFSICRRILAAITCIVLQKTVLAVVVDSVVGLPRPDLPFGDINIIVVTDVHSFIAGHPHEEDKNADYGDILSFYQHVKAYCDSQGADLWFFQNGDFVRGTGLAMSGNATMLIPLLEEMPWDAMNLGNHDTYRSGVVESVRDSMVPHFGDAFITSNTLDAATMEPFGGSRYRLLHGNNNTLLVFGFLYNLHNPSKLLHVVHVEDAVEEDWFRIALRENQYDAICVLAHMDNDDQLVTLILHKIREYAHEHVPVQFLTGHTHLRKYHKIENSDMWGRAMEAGGYLDTVGFLSIPTRASSELVKVGDVKNLFQYEFLNASKAVLRSRAGVETLLTEDGAALSRRINETRHALELDETIGCLPRGNYFLDRSIHDEDSVYKLWIEHVIPSQICKRQVACAMLISSSSFRYDILGSGRNNEVAVDDIVALVPYMEPVVYVGEVPEWALRRMNISINTQSLNHHQLYPDYILSGKFEAAGDKNKPYKFYTHKYNLPEIMKDFDRLYLHDLAPEKTDFTDTMYWLEYAETAWQCPHHKNRKDFKPWFADMNELDEADSDGGRTSEDEDTELEKELEHEGHNEDDSNESKLRYKGYEGYLPPSVIEQYKDKLPPGVAPGEIQKPKDPVAAPTPKNVNKKHAMTGAEKAKLMEHRKKVKKTTFKVIGLILAISLLAIPLCGLYRVFFPEKSGRDMSEESFYDMKEMRALRRRRGKDKLPIEIQMT